MKTNQNLRRFGEKKGNNNKISHAELAGGAPRTFASSTHAVIVNDTNLRGRFQIKFGMIIDNNRAFTLIELLVVVLIIGILASVALPQYQKAVEKARATQMLTLTKSIGQALDVYYQANGKLPDSFDELDVELPADWTGNNKIYSTSAIDVRSNADWSAVIEKQPGVIAGVHIGRLTGDYKGADFSYYIYSTVNIPVHQILCGEIKSDSTYIFGKNDGDFCEKLFKGTKVWDYGIRFYTLP